jgi:hypothetical protein
MSNKLPKQAKKFSSSNIHTKTRYKSVHPVDRMIEDTYKRNVREAKARADLHANPKADKGDKNGSCNRIDCQKPGAYYFNHSTRRYYCGECARLINQACRYDSFVTGLGHDLCTYENPNDEERRD